jgi:hypothetical protein
LLRFVLKFCQKYVIFKAFQVHLQVFLLLKNSGYKSFDIILKVQMLMKLFHILDIYRIRY